jgi:hypothetical protein
MKAVENGELHHAAPRCLLRLREAADAGEEHLWVEFEHEARRWGVEVTISTEELERLVEASTVLIEREAHRILHESDWQRWGRLAGMQRTGCTAPPGWRCWP